jgi:hypothetical protein
MRRLRLLWTGEMRSCTDPWREEMIWAGSGDCDDAFRRAAWRERVFGFPFRGYRFRKYAE